MDERCELAIIVINYKMENLTISFIKNELSKIKYPHKVVVVNNAATKKSDHVLCDALEALLVDNSLEGMLQLDKDVVVVSSSENLGFAKGNNLGVSLCKKWFSPNYYLFSNNDIVIKDEFVVEKLIERLETLPDVGVIGPKVIGLDGIEQSPFPYSTFWNRHIWSHWSFFIYSLEKKIEKFEIDYPQKAKEGYHYYVMGSFFLVRASDFYNCGMFDSTTFLYAEEMILSERMGAIGKNVYYYPEVTVVHAHGVTTKKYAKSRINDMLFESECYYYRTYKKTGKFQIVLGIMTHNLLKWFKKK